MGESRQDCGSRESKRERTVTPGNTSAGCEGRAGFTECTHCGQSLFGDDRGKESGQRHGRGRAGKACVRIIGLADGGPPGAAESVRRA